MGVGRPGRRRPKEKGLVRRRRPHQQHGRAHSDAAGPAPRIHTTGGRREGDYMVRLPLHDKHDHRSMATETSAEQCDDCTPARRMAMDTASPAGGSKHPTRALAHENPRERDSGLAGRRGQDGRHTDAGGGRPMATTMAIRTARGWIARAGERAQIMTPAATHTHKISPTKTFHIHTT